MEIETVSQVPAAHQPIYRLEAALLSLPQVDMPVEHEFCAGLYARTMRLFGGCAYTGAVHKSDSFFVVRSGVLASTTDSGSVVLRAGDMHVSRAGSKRAVVAMTDCVVTTFHPNPEEARDPAALWEMFTEPAPVPALEAA